MVPTGNSPSNRIRFPSGDQASQGHKVTKSFASHASPTIKPGRSEQDVPATQRLTIHISYVKYVQRQSLHAWRHSSPRHMSDMIHELRQYSFIGACAGTAVRSEINHPVHVVASVSVGPSTTLACHQATAPVDTTPQASCCLQQLLVSQEGDRHRQWIQPGHTERQVGSCIGRPHHHIILLAGSCIEDRICHLHVQTTIGRR